MNRYICNSVSTHRKKKKRGNSNYRYMRDYVYSYYSYIYMSLGMSDFMYNRVYICKDVGTIALHTYIGTHVLLIYE